MMRASDRQIESRTKIVATIGPASRSPAMISRLLRAGMNVARLNFSHGTVEEHGRTIADLRQAAEEDARPLAILQDLAGPKLRTGPVADGPVLLETGADFILTSRSVSGDEREVSVTYKELPQDVKVGDTLLLSDGELELEVIENTPPDIRCRVTVGGPLNSNKGINLPTRSISAPALTEKDRADLAFGVSRGVDYVALSFVRTAAEVEEARGLAREAGRSLPIIAKIEKREALVNIEEIIRAVDGIMIARGDLGVEIPFEEVPRVQKELVDRANRAAKPVITATQMLRSMVASPRPTRAEVTDVANAILDGSDAVMLSEETAVGEHPQRAVDTMTRIARSTEAYLPSREGRSGYPSPSSTRPQEAVAHAACQLAREVEAAAIVTTTQSGSTTRLVAKYRPARPIIAATPLASVCRELALVWGALPLLLPQADDLEAVEREAMSEAVKRGYLQRGQRVVMTAGIPLRVPGDTNLIRVLQV